VGSARATYIGTTPLADWRFRPLLRESGAPSVTSLSWARDGYVYFSQWDRAARTPVLVRLRGAGGAGPVTAAERVMALPDRCLVQSVVVATAVHRGACQTPDNRGDVYLARVPGIAR